MNVCGICKSRFSWECSDGYEAHSEKGCEYFSLDWDALSFDEKSAVISEIKTLKDGHCYRTDWDW